MKNYYKMQFIYVLRFFADAAVYLFLPRFFTSLGYSGWELGVLLAIHPTTSIIGNIIFSRLSKGNGRNIVLLITMLLVEGTAICLLGFIQALWLLIIVLIAMSLMNSSFFTMVDGVACYYSDKTTSSYGAIRICGSIAYLVSSFCAGFMIDAITYKYVFIISGLLMIVTIGVLISLTEKNLDCLEDKVENINIRMLFLSRSFMMFMISYVLLVAVNTAGDTVYGIYVGTLGITDSQFGMVIALQIIIEIFIMFLIIKFARKKDYKWLLVAAGAAIATKYLVLSLPLPTMIIISIPPVLRGLGWGVILAVRVSYLKEMYGERYVTKIIFIQTIICQIFTMCLYYIAPLIYENFSFNVFYSILLVLALVGAGVMPFIGKSKISNVEVKQE